MVATAHNLIHSGAYTLDQLAAFAGIGSTAKARRWLFGSNSGEAAVIPMYGRDESLSSFVDMVQLMAIRDIRLHRKISLDKIRETILVASGMGISYPFARKHQTYVFMDDVVIRLSDGSIVGATGKYRHDLLMEPIVERYMQDIGFDADGLAVEYTPMRDRGSRIVLSPKHRFGAPVVLPCNYTVETLVCAVQSEGSVLRAARTFGVDQADVRLALRYDESLRREPA